TPQREDASFAAFYLVSLGVGVLLISLRGGNTELLHVLFGTVLGLDDAALLLVSATSSITLLALALIFRPLVLECMDPLFLRSESRMGPVVHVVFLLLLVMTLVAGFQVLGTLMVVGIMMLPAAAARFWAVTAIGQMALAALVGAFASFSGLLLSYYANLPASPAIILAAGIVYFLSVTFGRQGGLWQVAKQARARSLRLSRIPERN